MVIYMLILDVNFGNKFEMSLQTWLKDFIVVSIFVELLGDSIVHSNFTEKVWDVQTEKC